MRNNLARVAGGLIFLAHMAMAAHAAPGDPIAPSPWTFDSDNPWPGDGQPSTLEADTPDRSLLLERGDVALSPETDLSGEAAVELSLWWSRGSDQDGGCIFIFCFDLDPESGDDLLIEYSADGGTTWAPVTTLPGDGPADEKGTVDFTLPQSALTTQFQLQVTNSGVNNGFPDADDRWFIDTVTLTEIDPESVAPICAANFAVYSGARLEIRSNVELNGNGVASGQDGNAIAADGARSDESFDLPALEPPPEPWTDGSDDPAPNDNIQGGNYSQIQIARNQTVSFSEAGGTYHMDELQIERGATIELAPGTYFIRQLSTEPDVTILPQGPVTLNVGNQAQFARQNVLNGGGDPGDLVIQLYDAGFSLGRQSQFAGVIYGPASGTNVTIGRRTEFDGGINVGGQTTIERDTALTFDRATQSLLGELSCAAFERFGIDVGSETASTCEQRLISITAADGNGNPVTDYSGWIDISTSSEHGLWTIADAEGTLIDSEKDDGDASYEFLAEDDGIIELYFSNQHADDLTISVMEDDGAPSATSDPLSFRHNAFVIEPRSRFANKDDDDLVAGLDQPFQATLIRREPADSTGQCGIATDYNNAAQPVKLWVARHADDPDGADPEANGTTLPDSKPDNSNITLDFSSSTLGQPGRAPFTLATSDVGKYSLMIEDTTFAEDAVGPGQSARPIAGGTMDYVVRPFAFAISSSRSDFTTTGAADDTADGPFVAAGRGFDVTVTAVLWQSNDDDNGDGAPDADADLLDNGLTPSFGNGLPIPTVDISHELSAPTASGTVEGTLSGGNDIGGFGSDIAAATETSLSFDEVGIIKLTADLAGYLGKSGADVTGVRSDIGRFIPARFEVIGNTPALAPFCGASTDFTYLDQSFGYSTDPQVTLTAYNAADAITKNYGGAFWKLPVPAAFPNRSYSDRSDSIAILDPDDDAPAPITSWTDDGDDSFSGSDTAMINGERLVYERNGLEGPFDAAADLTIPAGDLTDSDGVCPADDGICNTNDGDTGTDLVFDGDDGAGGQQPIRGAQLRFGRLRLDDAYGPEVEPVTQRWRLDYWTGTTWKRNEEDVCTVLTLVDEVELDPDDNRDSGDEVDGTQEVDLSSGDGSTMIEQPTPDVMGGVIRFDVGIVGVAEVLYEAPGAGDSGWIETRALLETDFPHLLSDTDGNGDFDNEPSARVTFGIYSGDSQQIYLREVFPSP